MATASARQRRQQAKRDYDAFMAECSTRQLLDSLSDKWLGLVLAHWARLPSAIANWLARSPE